MRGSRTTVVAVLTLTLLADVAHGVATGRWNGGTPGAPVMPPVPPQFGAWVGEDLPSNVDDQGLANLTRTYTHKKSGRSFVVSVTVGHPGLTAVHTPEYCYAGSGYEAAAPIETRAVDGPANGAFWTTAFRKGSAAGTEQLRIFWAWSAGGAWEAPHHPRLHFMGRPALYKLYVVAPGGADAAPGKDPALDDFLAGFLASLTDALFPRPTA